MASTLHARGRVSKKQQKRAIEAFTTLPVLPNCFCYNEMLLNNQLGINGHDKDGEGVKTRSWAPKHRGPMLLYTSTSVHRTPCLAWGYDPKKFESMVIVGIGNLVDVRELTDSEDFDMLIAFNNLERFRISSREQQTRNYARMFDLKAADKWGAENKCGPIRAFPNGLFFKNLKRFRKPIPFKPPKGAVSMFRAPLSLVSKALKKVGYDV